MNIFIAQQPIDLLFVSFGALTATVGILSLGSWFRSKKEAEIFIEMKAGDDIATKELKGEDTNFLALWNVTQDRLRNYHKIATDQARRSFLSSQIATIAGFILVIVVAFIAAQAKDPVAAISAGAVGVVGGGLSAYVGATFMKSQAEASAQLQQFFLQPVEFSKALSAERLIENLEPEHKAEAIKLIVTAMMHPVTPSVAKK